MKTDTNHAWIEIDGAAVGFYPAVGKDGEGPGQVVDDTPYSNQPDKVCHTIFANPCWFDIEAYKRALYEIINHQLANPPVYHWLNFNCLHWRDEVLTDAYASGNQSVF